MRCWWGSSAKRQSESRFETRWRRARVSHADTLADFVSSRIELMLEHSQSLHTVTSVDTGIGAAIAELDVVGAAGLDREVFLVGAVGAGLVDDDDGPHAENQDSECGEGDSGFGAGTQSVGSLDRH